MYLGPQPLWSLTLVNITALNIESFFGAFTECGRTWVKIGMAPAFWVIYFILPYYMSNSFKVLSFIVCYHVIRTLFSCVLEIHFSSVPYFGIRVILNQHKKTPHYSEVWFYLLPPELLVAYIDQFLFCLMFLCLMAYPTRLFRTGHGFIQREVN